VSAQTEIAFETSFSVGGTVLCYLTGKYGRGNPWLTLDERTTMAEFLELFVQPENMLFTASLFVFFGLMGLMSMGLGGDGGDAGVDAGVDVGVDVGDVGDVDVTVDADSGNASDGGYPIMCFLMPFFGFFGILGVLSNSVLPGFLDVPVLQKAGISIALSGIISWQVSGKIARSIASFLPSVKSYGLSTVDLAGSLGSVIGEKMDSNTITRISVTDSRDNIYKLRGQMLAGHAEVLHGGMVKIVKHDAASDICFCVPASGPGTPSSSSDSA
jgi:hypothetical protein